MSSIDLLEGNDAVATVVTNLPNTLNAGFYVPDVTPGSDYTIKVNLSKNSIGTSFPDLPSTLAGTSEPFTIVSSIE